MSGSSALAAVAASQRSNAVKRAVEILKEKLTPDTPQRCVIKVLRLFLLDSDGYFCWDRDDYVIRTRSLGAGVYEISLGPLKK